MDGKEAKETRTGQKTKKTAKTDVGMGYATPATGYATPATGRATLARYRATLPRGCADQQTKTKGTCPSNSTTGSCQVATGPWYLHQTAYKDPFLPHLQVL